MVFSVTSADSAILFTSIILRKKACMLLEHKNSPAADSDISILEACTFTIIKK